ncbi:S-layer family protein [Xanthomonas sp. MUS 060]|uniref:beta strand repeat-containing protein n=1 Tax=Xanthomonas sp. MUS 060 TaxID=1588031 RepID=UPI000698917E|nr:S-layer family protein [Xanthomonas sp. MUS 060]
MTIYYFARDEHNVNPDQTSSGASDPFAGMTTDEAGAPPFHYESDTLQYSNAYGTCTTNCVRLIAQYAYTDPDHILSHPQGTGGGGLEDNEQYRIATRTTVQDVLQPGAGPEAVIHSGGAMHIVTDTLHNTYARIAAGGDLSIDGITGAVSVTNLAQTLYRTDSFNNVTHAYNGTHHAAMEQSIDLGADRPDRRLDHQRRHAAHRRGRFEQPQPGPRRAQRAGRGGAGQPGRAGRTGRGQRWRRRSVAWPGRGVREQRGAGAIQRRPARQYRQRQRHGHGERSGRDERQRSGQCGGRFTGPHRDQAQSSGAQRASTGNASAMGTVSGQGATSGSVAVNAAGGSPDRIVMGGCAGHATAQRQPVQRAAQRRPRAGGDRSTLHQLDTQLPSASLFNVQPNGGHALVETDPRFTNYRVWLSSDAQLRQATGLQRRHHAATPGRWVLRTEVGARADRATDRASLPGRVWQRRLGYNADTMQQRLGDGYYEQKLVREQIGQLTGRRFLEGYGSDEAQYQALLDAGATVGKAWGLRPGVALTAAQMAQLTSDIVWLVAKTVTLPDGRTTTALVPQVYLRLHPGDLDSGGALLAGANVDAHVSGTLTNTGTIAGRQLVSLDAGRIDHLGGSISGNQVALSSASDIRIQGASVSAVDALSVRAAGNIEVASTVETLQGGGHQEAITRVAGLYVTGANGGGVLSVVGGGDVTLQAAQVRNAGTDGVTQLVAGHDLTLGAQTLTHTQYRRHARCTQLPTQQRDHACGEQRARRGRRGVGGGPRSDAASGAEPRMR